MARSNVTPVPPSPLFTSAKAPVHSRRSIAAKSVPTPPSRQEDLHDFTARSMLRYGSYVVEQRAIPDYRDGLKPVHRAILWSMHNLGLRASGGYKKSARTVGDTIGMYHPHGDSAVYDAMAGLVNLPVPLIDGYGGWGDHCRPQASSRYTEAKLSKFTDLFLLDSDYLAVSPMVPNYSEDKQIPLVLPAKLPVLLLIGSMGIAYGVAAGTPSFKLDGVVALTQQALLDRANGVTSITGDVCANTLQFDFKWGGICRSPRADLVSFYNTGKATLTFAPSIQKVFDGKHREYVIRSTCPGWQSLDGINKMLDKIAALSGVTSVTDDKDMSGCRYVVTLSKTAAPDTVRNIFAAIDKLLLKTESYDIGVTDRQPTTTQFFRASVPELIYYWADWRIDLERRVLRNLAAKEKVKIAKNRLLIYIISNIDVVVAALKDKDTRGYLLANLQLTSEQVDDVLNYRVHQLKRMDITTLNQDIATSKALLQTLASDFKTPVPRIVADLNALIAKKGIAHSAQTKV
jgi:DNA gyrase/topoisomerase IV subunit A